MSNRRTTQQLRRRSGFTLIELVASAILSALMMVALIGIVWSAMQESRQLRLDKSIAYPGSLVSDLLRSDLQNARGMRLDRNGVQLHGFLSRDRATSRPLMREGAVRYEAANVTGRRTLVRRTFSGGEADVEPLWIGFGELRIESLATPVAGDEVNAPPLPPPATGGLASLPAVLRITMTNTNGKTVWREVIHHHAE